MLYVGMDSLQHPLTGVLIRKIRLDLQTTHTQKHTDTVLVITSIFGVYCWVRFLLSSIVHTNCNKLSLLLVNTSRGKVSIVRFLHGLITACHRLETH